MPIFLAHSPRQRNHLWQIHPIAMSLKTVDTRTSSFVSCQPLRVVPSTHTPMSLAIVWRHRFLPPCPRRPWTLSRRCPIGAASRMSLFLSSIPLVTFPILCHLQSELWTNERWDRSLKWTSTVSASLSTGRWSPPTRWASLEEKGINRILVSEQKSAVGRFSLWIVSSSACRFCHWRWRTRLPWLQQTVARGSSSSSQSLLLQTDCPWPGCDGEISKIK